MELWLKDTLPDKNGLFEVSTSEDFEEDETDMAEIVDGVAYIDGVETIFRCCWWRKIESNFPERSGDPNCCPENEGHGCCDLQATREIS